MNEIETINRQLPDSLPDLAKFALIGREKLNAVRAEIRAIEKVGLAKEVHEQKLIEAQEIAEAVLDAEMKIGELTKRIPKATGGQPFQARSTMDSGVQSKKDIVEQAGFTVKQTQRFETLAKHPEAVEKAKAIARENGDIVSRQSVMRIIAADTPQPPKKTNSAHEAKQRHAEFEEKKAEGIVSIQDARQDKEDQKQIARELYKDLMSLTTKGYWIGALNNSFSFGLLRDVVTDKDRMRDRIQKLMIVLEKTLEVLS